jgi:hypothetical protein
MPHERIRADQILPVESAASGGNSGSSIPTQQIQDTQKAYLVLGRNVLEVADTISLPLRVFGLRGFFSADAQTPDLVVLGKLDMLLIFLSGYLLPMLYGLLGACAFVLRKLSDEIDKLTYAHDARVRYSLRLNIGMLTGLAVGWFIKPGAGDAALVSLSPLALAFIAGYGSDLFFTALDKIVQAFAPAGGSASSTTKEVTAGGITTTTSQSTEAHVAGRESTTEEGKKTPTLSEAKAPIGETQIAGRGTESDEAKRVRLEAPAQPKAA